MSGEYGDVWTGAVVMLVVAGVWAVRTYRRSR